MLKLKRQLKTKKYYSLSQNLQGLDQLQLEG